MDRLATVSEAVTEYVFNAGRDRKDSAWILSPLDTWHKNPFYKGPPQPHPEDPDDDYFLSEETQ